MQSLVVDEIKIEAYKKTFRIPYIVNGVALKFREGFILTIKAQGLIVASEASPLEGYSYETLKKAHHDLKRFKDVFLNKSIPTVKEELFVFLNNYLDGSCASVRFAYESAFLELAAQSASLKLLDYLGGVSQAKEGVGLLQGSNVQIRDLVAQYVKQGCRIFKLKVGDRNIPLDVIKVRDVKAAMGAQGLLRLDANRSWKLSEAVLFSQMIDLNQIQFIEEPLIDPSQIPAFVDQTNFPVAIDETLLTSRCDVTAPGRCMPTLANHDAVKFYIVKPSLLGGVIVSLQWITQAKRLSKQCVISSMFETEIGMKTLQVLSHFTDQSPGFGTSDWMN